MTIAKIVSAIGLAAMTGIIAYGFIVGDFGAEGAWIVAHPWGQVSLVDVYTSILLFSTWMFYREKSVLWRIIWLAIFIVMGNWGTALYVLLALNASDGNWQKFFNGYRA